MSAGRDHRLRGTTHAAASEPEQPLGNARGFIRKREFLLVRVRCDDGLTGWGEAFSSPWAAAALIRHQFAAVLIGRSPERHGQLYDAMLQTLGYDRRGSAMMAVSALDIALHDAAARARGVSVADLLGGALRDRVFAYASGPFMREQADPYAGFRDEAERYLRRGFKALKPRAGLGPREDAAMVADLRAAVGPDVGLMVDINQGYPASTACAAVRAMEPAGLMWIEEPVGPEDVAGYRAVAAASGVPVAGGEALANPAAFRQFLEAGALALVQPDLAVCGGFSGFQRIAALAGAHGLPVMPHMFSTTVNFHAALQMASLLPAWRNPVAASYPFVEYDPTGNPLMDLLGDPIDADGWASLPDRPGLGFDLAPDRLSPWLAEHWSVAA